MSNSRVRLAVPQPGGVEVMKSALHQLVVHIERHLTSTEYNYDPNRDGNILNHLEIADANFHKYVTCMHMRIDPRS